MNKDIFFQKSSWKEKPWRELCRDGGITVEEEGEKMRSGAR